MSWQAAILLAIAALPAGALVGAIVGMLALRAIGAVRRQWGPQ